MLKPFLPRSVNMCKTKSELLLLPNKINSLPYVKFNLMIVMEDINRLKIVLVERKKTGKWLAEQLGRDPSTISKWCTNVSQPDLVTLSRIAELLNIERRELINKSK